MLKQLDNVGKDVPDDPVDDEGGSSGGDIGTTIAGSGVNNNIAINKEAIELHHKQPQPTADLPQISSPRLKI